MLPSASVALALAAKSTAILAAARLVTLLLRRGSAAARHQVWTAASAAIILLPLLTVALPAWRPAATAALPSAIFQITATATPAVNPTSAVASPVSSVARPEVFAIRPSISTSFLYLWIAGSFAVWLPLVFATFKLRRLQREASASPYRDLSAQLASELEISRRVALLETPPGTMPMTLGIVHPIVFLPADAREWTADRRRMVLLHELAHVRRADVATQFLSRIALTLNWWNPLAWTAWREALKERERAADDLVLRSGARASDYAGHLLEIARSMQSSPLGSAAICMARRAQLETRLLAILDTRSDRKSAGRIFALATMLAAAALVLPLAALHAQQPAATPGKVSPDVDAAVRSAVAQQNGDSLDQPAQAFANKNDFDTARALLDTAASIRAGVSGTGSVNYGLGLIKIGDLEARRKNTPEAIAFYSKAVQILGGRPEAVPALNYLGVRAMTAKNYDQAATYFQTAQALNAPQSGTSAMWMGVLKDRLKDPSGADAMFQNALALQDPKSADAATTMLVYSQFLKGQGRTDESNALMERAKAVRPPESPAPSRFAVTGALKPGNGVSALRLLKKQEPAYSDEARVAKLQGTVLVSIVVGADGLPSNILVIKSLGLGLDQSAIDAVSQWVFAPGMKDSGPVPVAASIEVNFRLL